MRHKLQYFSMSLSHMYSRLFCVDISSLLCINLELSTTFVRHKLQKFGMPLLDICLHLFYTTQHLFAQREHLFCVFTLSSSRPSCVISCTIFECLFCIYVYVSFTYTYHLF